MEHFKFWIVVKQKGFWDYGIWNPRRRVAFNCICFPIFVLRTRTRKSFYFSSKSLSTNNSFFTGTKKTSPAAKSLKIGNLSSVTFFILKSRIKNPKIRILFFIRFFMFFKQTEINCSKKNWQLNSRWKIYGVRSLILFSQEFFFFSYQRKSRFGMLKEWE